MKLTRPFIIVRPRKPLPLHPRCDIGRITEAVREKGAGENWDEHVLYNKLILQQLRTFKKHLLRNPGNSMAALLRISVEVTENGKGLEKKRKSKPRGKAARVQAKRKNGYSLASAAIGAHLEYYVNLSAIAFP